VTQRLFTPGGVRPVEAQLPVDILEADFKTPLPREFNFTDPEKLKELAKRGAPQRHGRWWNWLLSKGRVAATCI
jgi:hypothetical protein